MFIINIVFPESEMQLESNHDDEGNENFQEKKKTLIVCVSHFSVNISVISTDSTP